MIHQVINEIGHVRAGNAVDRDMLFLLPRLNPRLDMTPYVCSSSMMTMYQLGGVVVLLVAAWAAFKIAFF
ncbi:hypothetical protein [Ralstonia pseudosolanacearum]